MKQTNEKNGLELIPASPEERAAADRKILTAIAHEAEQQEELAPNKYRKLVRAIRASSLTGREVSRHLVKTEQLTQARVSEIMRVAKAPAELFKRFDRGTIGFRVALREARVSKMSPAEARDHAQEELNRHAKKLCRFVHSNPSKLSGGTYNVECFGYRINIVKVSRISAKKTAAKR